MNEETRYLIHMIVTCDFAIANLRRAVRQYPDDWALVFSLVGHRHVRQDLIDRLDRARLMDEYLDEVQR